MPEHFILTGESKEAYGRTLWRIRATRDLPLHGVKKGDLGGWVWSKANLSDEAWIADDAVILGKARITGQALVHESAMVDSDAVITDRAKVGGEALVTGEVKVSDNAVVAGSAEVRDTAWVYGNARITGTAEIGGDSEIFGDARLFAPVHLLSLNVVGFEDFSLDLYPTTTGHLLRVGDWSGSVDDLKGQVREWTQGVGSIAAQAGAIATEFEAVRVLCLARMARWAAENLKDE